MYVSTEITYTAPWNVEGVTICDIDFVADVEIDNGELNRLTNIRIIGRGEYDLATHRFKEKTVDAPALIRAAIAEWFASEFGRAKVADVYADCVESSPLIKSDMAVDRAKDAALAAAE